MSDLDVQLKYKNKNGGYDQLYPRTKGHLIQMDDGRNVEEILDELNTNYETVITKYATNHFDPEKLTKDVFIHNGVVTPQTGWAITGHIPVKLHDRVYGAWCNGANLSMCALFDKDLNYLKSVNGTVAGKPYDFYVTDPKVAWVVYNVRSNSVVNYAMQYLIVEDQAYLRDKPEYMNDEIIRTTTLTVGQSGRNYTSLLTALLQIKDSNYLNRYTIEIDEGMYNVVSEILPHLTSGQFNIINEYGLFVPDYVDIIGTGRKENTTIYGNIANDYPNPDVVDKVSTLNIPYNTKLKNLTIRATNFRYAVHSDNAMTDNTITNNKLWDTLIEAENCDFIHYGVVATHTYFAPASWGEGTWDGSIRKFDKCRFISNSYAPYLTHNRTGLKKPSEHLFIDCEFINNKVGTFELNAPFEWSSLLIQSLSSELNERFQIIGCRGNSYISVNENVVGGGIDYDVSGYGNQIPVVIRRKSASDRGKTRVKFSDEVVQKENSGSAVTVGTPVAVVGTDTRRFRAMAPSDKATLFMGIAYEDIVAGSVGVIKNKGYMTLSEMGLTASVGDTIGIVNGLLAVSSDNVIGKVVSNGMFLFNG